MSSNQKALDAVDFIRTLLFRIHDESVPLFSSDRLKNVHRDCGKAVEELVPEILKELNPMQEPLRKVEKKYKCGHCNYQGFCYGQPHSNGVSAPWCYKCGMNNKLTIVV